MNSRVKNLLNCIYIVFILAISCTKEIKLKPSQEKGKLVINSLLTTDSLIKVKLFCTKSITGSGPAFISSAKVKLFENGICIDTLSNLGGGNYWSGVIPSSQKKYELTAEDSNFPTVSSREQIPIEIQLTDATFKYIGKLYHKTIQDYIETSEISLSFKDTPSEKNYYEVIFFVYNPGIKFTDIYSLFFDSPILTNEGDADYEPTSLFFSDELFDGQQFTFKTKLPFSAEMVNGQWKPHDLYVSFRSISYNYYKYRKLWTRHRHNQNSEVGFWEDIFKGEPIDMFTNVENGYGIFAGYSQDVRKLTYIP